MRELYSGLEPCDFYSDLELCAWKKKEEKLVSKVTLIHSIANCMSYLVEI